jgi:hypothetical protein
MNIPFSYPLLLQPTQQVKLKLTEHKEYKKGIIRLEYSVKRIDLF